MNDTVSGRMKTICSRYELTLEMDNFTTKFFRELPPSFSWVDWTESINPALSKLTFSTMSQTEDAKIFPRFQTLDGCRKAIYLTTTGDNFCPQASGGVLKHLSRDTNSLAGGVLVAVLENGMGWIQNYFVAQDFRGNGLGEFLIGKSLQNFRNLGLEQIGAHVTTTNEPSKNIFLRFGFKIAGTINVEPKNF